MMDCARPTRVLLSYSLLMLSSPSDEDNFYYFLDRPNTTAIQNSAYQIFSTKINLFLCHSQARGTFNQKENGAELLSQTWTKALGVNGLFINIFFSNG